MTGPKPAVPPQAITDERERLGRIACEAWSQWADEQPKPWPVPRPAWEDCHPGTRESFRRIAEAVAAAEREWCAQLAEQVGAGYVLVNDFGFPRDFKSFADLLREQP